MIDKEIFVEEWKSLLVRFGRKAEGDNVEQGRRFYAFLSPQMNTETFVRAARSVWATSRFFPRPADFLTADAGKIWGELLSLLRSYRPPIWGEGISAQEWWERWRALPEAAREAADSLGDVETLKRLAETQSMKFREQWERAFEQERTAEAVAALPLPKAIAQLTSGSDE